MTHLAPFERHGEVEFERPLLTAACSEGHLQPLRATHCLCGAAPPGEGRAAMQELTPTSPGERARSRMENYQGPQNGECLFSTRFHRIRREVFLERLLGSLCLRPGRDPRGVPFACRAPRGAPGRKPWRPVSSRTFHCKGKCPRRPLSLLLTRRDVQRARGTAPCSSSVFLA